MDRIWRGYDIRALIPAAGIAGGISLILLVERWISVELSTFAEGRGIALIYIPMAIIWTVLIAVGLYRSVTYTYRLTDRAVLIDRGFRWRPSPLIPLESIAEVSSALDFFGRRFDVGRVIILTSSGSRTELTGVRGPAAFAVEIRAEVRRRLASTKPGP